MECRICLSDEHPETMLVPCRCRGTSAYVHSQCLRTYFVYYPDRICRVCHERMEHPWVDRERTLTCAVLLLVWSALLVTLSAVPLAVKCLTYSILASLVLFHAHRKQLTYETTILCLASSTILACADPRYLTQMVLLTTALLVLATLCIFLPPELVFLMVVMFLALTYSLLLLLALASRTDPAFTALAVMAMGIFWLVFLRPGHRNALYR